MQMSLPMPPRWRRLACACLSALWLSASPAQSASLGVEGQVFEIIEDDFRLTLMRLIAQHDWAPDTQALQESVQNYTKNLPAAYLPRAEKTLTRWKDVGVVVTEDIYLPWVDWATGSVFEPERTLAVQAGTYLNPIAHLPAAGIERLVVFDATDPEQLAWVKTLMAQHIPQLNFALVAGDLGPLSEEMQQPVYHMQSVMLEKFQVRAAPTLIGFGRGRHQGHMAITEISLPADPSVVQRAWFGLGDTGEADASDAPAAPNQKD